jgi:hypothetical protein
MMSRGNGEAPRQEPKKRKTSGKQKQGGGGFAGWRKPPHPALAKVDQNLLRGLQKWSAQKTFAHQFRVTATPVAPATPPTQMPPTAGLAAVKHAQWLERAAALEAAARQEGRTATGRGSSPSGLGELYEFHKRNGTLAVFFSLYPPLP